MHFYCGRWDYDERLGNLHSWRVCVSLYMFVIYFISFSFLVFVLRFLFAHAIAT
jgi:hypothetical protein